MTACRKCSQPFEPKTWQILKLDYECPACAQARQAAYRAKRKAEGNPVRSGKKMPPEYHKAYQASYFTNPDNQSRRNARMRGYSAGAMRARHQARWMLHRAIKAGRIHAFPCEVCGAPKMEAHHVAYDMPLDVVWLCKQHHRQVHQEAKANGAA